MRLRDLGELELVRRIRAGWEREVGAGGTVLGIGDDAAVIAPPAGGRGLAVTLDMMCEGVHFDLSLIQPRQLGYKLVAVNVSDIFAMRGSPRHLFLGLAMSGETPVEVFDGIMEGVREGCLRYGIVLVGGDMNAAPEGTMTLAATLVGECPEGYVTRAGASPGDDICVSGTLGDSALGLELLRRLGRRVDLDVPHGGGLIGWDAMRPLLERHLKPSPSPLPGGCGRVTAMMDLSDGLAMDLPRLCAESGTGAEIYEDLLPVSAEARLAAGALGLDPLEIAIGGGEDYLLLYTVGPGGAPGAGRRIGVMREAGYGCRVVGEGGSGRGLGGLGGYEHFGRG